MAEQVYRVTFADGHEALSKGDCALTAAKRAQKLHKQRVLKAVLEITAEEAA